MVLGLIDFLLGGKKKTKVPRTAQVGSSVKTGADVGPTPDQGPKIPDGQSTPTPNAEDRKTDNSPVKEEVPQTGDKREESVPVHSQSSGGKKSFSEVLSKIHKELKESNERISGLVTDVKNLENSVSEIGHRVDTLESNKKMMDEKVQDIDSNMSKFLSLYELINNEYNPFIDKDSLQEKKPVKEIVLGSGGDSKSEEGHNHEGKIDISKALHEIDGKSSVKQQSFDALEDSLLELDTLNIEEAAGDAVPLTRLKNNTNSLVIILSWLEYLIKRVGIEETRNSLRYYTEVLRWTTPEVYFDLDKYLRGMKDNANVEEGTTLSVKDHIVSLYFISKLNEKSLDEKLTKAVLQIIKQ